MLCGLLSTAPIIRNGNPGGVRGIVLDITDRKRAEEALRESEDKYRSMVERANDGIGIVQDGVFKYANPRLAEIGDYAVEELIDKPFTDFVHPDEVAETVEYYTRRIWGEKMPVRYERRLLHKSGRTIHSEVSGGVVTYQNRTADLIIVRDITRRKRVEEALKQSREELRNLASHSELVRERERGRIAREIHDELGQALTALKMDLHWLANKLPKEESLLAKTRSMSNLIDVTVHAVQRISSELRPGLLDNLGLSAAVEWQAREFEERTGILFDVDIDPEEIVLDQDRSTAIFRIFQETLTNVTRHAKAGKVEVILKEKSDAIELKVRDNGRGITEDQISDPRSFGLMGIRERVHGLQGYLSITGASNKGTTVMVNIPLDKEEASDD
jgi:PAS domain S-box-containing protein